MFVVKLLCALALAAPLALALQVDTPTGWLSSSQENVTWTATSSDPTFSIELNHPTFNNKIAIANNVNPATLLAQVTLPVVPSQDGYTIEFVNIGNITQVYTTSNSFSIGPPPSSTSSGTTSSGTSSNSASSPSVSTGTSTTGVGSTSASGGAGIASATPSTFSNTGGAAALTSNGVLGFAVMAAAALAGAQFLGF